MFAIFAGFYYWFEKMCGVKYNEFLGAAHFWITFVGVNVVFFPQHFLGLQGMPRRYVDYPDAFTLWNHVSSIGYVITVVGVGVFLVMLAGSRHPSPPGRGQPLGRRRHDAGVDPALAAAVPPVQRTAGGQGRRAPLEPRFRSDAAERRALRARRPAPWPSLRPMTETDTSAPPTPAQPEDFLQLLKPRVMSLVVFTAATGMVVARGR